MKYKIGDKVKFVGQTDSEAFTIKCIDAMGNLYKYDGPDRGITCRCRKHSWQARSRDMILVGRDNPTTSQALPKFILQYELDKDPFEFFATEKEARKRIAELAERADLRRDSIRLIEIKKIRTVKLGVKFSISK